MQGNLSAERMCALATVSRAGFYRSFQQREPDLEEMELRSAIQTIAVEHKLHYGYHSSACNRNLFMWQSFSMLSLEGVVGWALDRSLAAQLAVDAPQQAIANRRPGFPGWMIQGLLRSHPPQRFAPGLVHHSDRGIQYASTEYENVLDKRRMIASMSRLGNPWDNAKCENFMKTLKQEEIRANEYRDLEHLRKNVKEFVEHYYNGRRLHSALGYQTPEAFEKKVTPATANETESVSFLRHGEIYQSDVLIRQKPPEDGFRIHRVDESPTDYSLPGWSPPEPDSASPVSVILKRGRISGKKK
jgi:putative transposase